MSHVACHAFEIETKRTDGAQSAWVHLIPAGSFHGRDGRGPYRVADANRVIAASNEYAANQPIPVDYDHQIDHAKANGAPAIAAGWIEQMEARADGIWGQVKWTDKAANHIAAQEYRFLSPVFEHVQQGQIIRILRAALTNNPNLTQLAAVAAMEANHMEALLQKLRAALGLPETATEDDVVASVSAPGKTDGKNPDPTKFVPMAEFQKVVAELNRINAGIERKTAEAHVADQIVGGRLPPYLRDWGIELCTVNKPAFDNFVDSTKRFIAPLFKQIVPSGPPPERSLHNALTEEERDAAKRVGLTPEEFSRGKRETYS